MLPGHLRRLLALPDIDAADLAFLTRRLGVTTVGELSWAIDDGLVRSLREIGPAKAARLGQAVAGLKSDRSRIPLGRARTLFESIESELRSRCMFDLLTPAGSLRRFETTVGDVEALAVAVTPDSVIESFTTLPDVSQVLHRSPTKATVRYDRDEVTLRAVPPPVAGPALIHYTGSATHNDRLRRHAATSGFVLGPDVLRSHRRYDNFDAPTEQSVYAVLGLPFIPPELREGTGEIEAALAGTLPTLLEAQDIRGDLHMHSTWSDGGDSIEAMASACLDLGYEYLAITDHSQSSSMARGLDADRLRQQREDIERVRRMLPGIAILHGTEVDILPDGRLDFPDDLLAGLDIVLASLHNAAGQGGDQLTSRYLAAMRHPLVSIVTHPTNRLVGQRRGYDLDVDALIQGAIETGTVLEIDGAPSHLDMDGAMTRRAIDAGVMVSVDSDCHRAAWLRRQMSFGVATARRGWAEARHVLNTQPLGQLRSILNRKRERA